jgi:hypothetical protein
MYNTHEHSNSFIPLGSINIQFSTIFNKHRKRISNNKNKTCNQWTNIISVCIDTFSSNIVGTLYHLKASLLKINPKTANDKKKNLIAIINLCL